MLYLVGKWSFVWILLEITCIVDSRVAYGVVCG